MATALSDEEMDETTGTKKMAVAQSDEEMDETRGTETEAEDEIPLSAICKKLEEEFATPMKPVPKSAEPDLMKVYLRVRPCSAKEEAKGEDQNCIIIENETTLLTNAPRDSQTFKNSTHGCGKTHHKFCFSKIFDEDTTQQDFFDNTMLSTVKQFVEGENCLVFTYGVTNSGKTYTIQGNSKQAGLLPRALDVIFNSISDRQLTDVNLKPTMFNNVVRLTPAMQEQEKKLKDSVMRMANDEDTDSTAAHDEDGLSTVQESMSEGSVVNEASVSGSSSKSALEEAFAEVEATRQRESAAINVDNQGQIKFSVWVNFVEIYNELVFDLLVPVPINKNRRTVLHLREDKKGVPYVRGLKEICVNNADEAFKVLTIGQRNLQTACTKLNHNSSRSHCIFNIKLLRVVDKDRPNMARISMLSLCDLAGSERYAKAQTFGDRMKEGGNINASLLTLGRCINVLRHNQLGKENMRIVPFRESKLTRMFQSYFFGRGRACMIVNINKNASTFDETLHALKYSAVAKQVVVLTEPVSQPKIRPKKPLNTKDTKKQVKEDLTDLKRQTIGWASPKTMKELLDLEAKGDGCPVPDGDDFDLSEDGNATCDTTATGDNTAATGDNKTQQQALLSIIDELKKELMNEKKKQLIMESRIREEVCNEMAEQLVEIENEYSERLKREQIMQEEKFDKRLELYAQSVKKNRKRKRLVPDEDGGEASGPRVEELERVNTRLEEQVKAYEKEITELKQRLDNAVGHTPEYYQLQEQVRLAESERTELKREAHQLRQEKDYLEQKLNEASTVVDSVEELQQLVEGSQAQLKAAEERLQAKDETIRRLQGLVDAPTTQTGPCKDCQNYIVEMGEMVSKISDLETNAEKYEQRISKLQQMTDILNSDIIDKQDKIDDLENHSKSLDKHVTELKELLEKEKEKSKQVGDSHHTYKTALQDSETVIGSLNTSLKQLRQRLMEKDTELKTCQTKEVELVNTLKTVQDGYKSLEEKLETEESSHKQIVHRLNEQIKELSVEDDGITKLNRLLSHHEGEQAILQGKVDELQTELHNAKFSSEKDQEKAQKELEKQMEEMKVLKADLKHAHQNLEDYILKVNEQAEEMGDTKDKLKLEKELTSTLQAQASEAKLKIADLMKQLTEATEKVEFLQKEKAAEKTKMQEKIQKESRKSMDASKQNLEQVEKILHEKNVRLEAVQAELRAAVEAAAAHTVDATKAKDDLSNLTRQLADMTTAHDKVLAEKLELSAKLLDTETNLTNAKKSAKERKIELEEAQKKVEDLTNKIAELKEVKHRAEELETELQKSRLLEEKSQKELERQQQLDETSHKDTDAELAKLKKRVKEAEDRADEAEYRHTMALRQAKREKTQVENLLRESEAALAESRQRHASLEAHLAEDSRVTEDDRREMNEKMQKHAKEIANLEEAVRDLEQCLRSSKQSEARLLEYTEGLKTRLKGLEVELDEKEKTIQELEQSMLGVKNESLCLVERQVESDRARLDLSDARQSIDRLEAELAALRLAKGQLETELEVARQKLHVQTETFINQKDSIQQKVEELREKHQKERSELAATLAAVREELANVTEDRDSVVRRMQSTVDNLNKAHDELEALRARFNTAESRQQELVEQAESEKEEMRVEVATIKEKMEELEFSLKEKECELQKETSEIEKKTDESNKKVEEQADEIASLEAKVEELEEALTAKTEACEAKEEAIEDLDNRLEEELARVQVEAHMLEAKTRKAHEAREKELLTERDEKAAEADTLREEVSTLKKDVHKLQDELRVKTDALLTAATEREQASDKMAALSSLRDENQTLLTQIATMREAVNNLKEKCMQAADLEHQLKDKALEIDRLKEEQSQLKLNLELKTSDVGRLQEKCSDFEARLAETANVKVELEKQLSSIPQGIEDDLSELKEKHSRLEEELTSVSNAKSKLEADLSARESSIESYNKQITLLKQEAELLEEQVKKSSDRESTLRKQLQLSADDLGKRNSTIEKLEDQVTSLQKTADDSAKQFKEAESRIRKLESELEEAQSAVDHSSDKLKSQIRENERSIDSLESELKNVKKDLEKKESRLKQRTKAVEELMEKIESERKSFEIALQDAKSNEMLITTLKSALEEQEETMQTQDTVIKNKEDEILTLSKELECAQEKYTALLGSSSEGSSRQRALSRQLAQLEADKAAADTELERLRGELHEARMEADRNKVEVGRMQQSSSATLSSVEEKYSGAMEELATVKNALDAMKRKHASADREADRLREQFNESNRKLTVSQNEVETLTDELADVKAKLDKMGRQDSASEETSSEMRKELREMKKSLNKAVKDKSRLEADMHDNVKEIQELEKKFKEITKENDQLKKEVELARDSVKESKEKSLTSSGAHTLLVKRKFEALEGDKRQLQKELDQVKEEVENIAAKKDKELQKWREERDKLVSGLETILKTKEDEIRSLKAAAAARSRNHSGSASTKEGMNEKLAAMVERVTSMEKQLKHDIAEMDCLKTQLKDKDAMIADLSRHLESMPTPRSTRRGRTHSHTADDASSLMEEVDNLRKEVSILHHQLERERAQASEKLNTVVRCKDAIISDLKDQNLQLQSQLPYQLQVRVSDGHMPEDVAMSAQCNPATPPAKKSSQRRATRGRQTRKRKSDDVESTSATPDTTLDENSASGSSNRRGSRARASRSSRSSAATTRRSSRQSEAENHDPSATPLTPGAAGMGVIREEDVVDLSMLGTARSPGRLPGSPPIRALLTPANYDVGSALTTPRSERVSTFVSPTSTGPPTTGRKKRRLKATHDDMFTTTPTDTPTAANDPPPKADDVHKIVTRKLRSNRRK